MNEIKVDIKIDKLNELSPEELEKRKISILSKLFVCGCKEKYTLEDNLETLEKALMKYSTNDESFLNSSQFDVLLPIILRQVGRGYEGSENINYGEVSKFVKFVVIPVVKNIISTITLKK